MSEVDQFWQYAREAILSAAYAKIDEDKQGLLDLARTWTQAALRLRATLVDCDNPRVAHSRAEPILIPQEVTGGLHRAT